ncbi:MAG: LacI family DNA-binding transcriptional regulator [Anaerolineae bacterium]
MMTLQKIAELAGVSKSTVSRVINNDPNVKENTRERVQAIIDAQQYQSNPAARALASRHTKILGVVIPNNIGILFDRSFYFPTILRGISQAARDRDYAMLLMLGDDSEDDLRFARRIVHNQIMDGLALISPSLNHPIIDELISAKTTFVSADRIPRADVAINFVTVENVESSKKAVNHLIGLGRRRIAMLAGDTRIIDSLDRIAGYRLALESAGIPFEQELVIETLFEYDDAYSATQQLITVDKAIDGIYAGQSTLALAAVNALLDAGRKLPDDISLIAFDDLADAMNPRIGISTMRQPVFEKGYQITEVLLDLIEEKVTPPVQRYLPAELVIRDTCGGKAN